MVITSRNDRVRHHATPTAAIRLGDLDEDEAVALLLKRTELDASVENMGLAAAIVLELGCMALAVTVASGPIVEGVCTLAEFLPLYHKQTLLQRSSGQTIDAYPHTLWRAFEISFLQPPSGQTPPSDMLPLSLLLHTHCHLLPSGIYCSE